jgi:hypothetical protein
MVNSAACRLSPALGLQTAIRGRGEKSEDIRVLPPIMPCKANSTSLNTL